MTISNTRKKTTAIKDGIYKRGNSWYILFRDESGRQVRKSCGTDKRTAELALAEIKKRITTAKAIGDWSGMEEITAAKNYKTFDEAAKEYMLSLDDPKPSTLTSYNNILQCHLLPSFGKSLPRQISEDEIRRFQNELRTRGLSERRVNCIVQLLRSILAKCVKQKLIKSNPADDVKRIREPNADIDPLSREEIDIALAHVDAHFRPLFTCLAWTGARPNELLALRWGSIDWRRQQIQIKLGRVRGKEALPKSRASERVIPALPPVMAALEELKHRPVRSSTDHVFVGKKGEPINKHLDRIWTRALKHAGLRHRPSYQLRHTFASIALEQGASPGWVSKVLGHGSMEITFRHYARFINDASARNEQIMCGLFAETSPESEQAAKVITMRG